MNLKANANDPSNIVMGNTPEEVLKEILEIAGRIYSDFDAEPVRHAFDAVARLYHGDFPGYRACNTGYHDFPYAIETLLTMSRLVHGAVLAGQEFTRRQFITALIATAFHDAGYIQEASDRQGAGAKYKTTHERRSMDFLSRHGSEFGLSEEEIAAGRCIIHCTDMAADIAAISFPSAPIELLGKMLGTADVADYESELDIPHKAGHFYDFFEARLKTALGGVDRFMRLHFASRWGLDRNLYHEAIQRQRNYLTKILKIPDADPRDYLRRGGIVKKIRKTYPKT